MLTFPNAKINIGLQITSKREDGYHNIESIFYPVPFKDALEAVPYTRMRFQTAGIEIPGRKEDNICIKAWELLHQEHEIENVDMFLYKHIPAGSGLGGGSADAAYTLKLLNSLFELSLTNDQLKEYAARLGSDCPFFIDNIPAIVRGRGEVLEKADLSLDGYYIKLVIPDVHISTAEAYSKIHPVKADYPIEKVCITAIEEWKEFVVNDFEKIVFNMHPHLKKIRDQLYDSGALYASMSGSGSAFYGIYKDQQKKGMFEGMMERVGRIS